MQFSQAGQESQNCLRSEQNQTFYEFINNAPKEKAPRSSSGNSREKRHFIFRFQWGIQAIGQV
ncbi:MAG: hypothetical protein OEL58_09485, partial [Desulfobacteraceae bacterium]|nr:hypothetical protein [Desulfobacteraceae bacterium]